MWNPSPSVRAARRRTPTPQKQTLSGCTSGTSGSCEGKLSDWSALPLLCYTYLKEGKREKWKTHTLLWVMEYLKLNVSLDLKMWFFYLRKFGRNILTIQTFYFIFLGKFAHQSHSVNTDPCEFHETGKRYTGLAAQGRCQSVQEGRWEQRAQTSDLPGWTERTEKWTSSQNRPDQVCRWMSFTVLFLLKLVSASHSIKEKDS